MNEKYGTTFGRFSGTPAEVRRCCDLIERRPTLSPYLLGFESGEVTLVAVRGDAGLAARSTRDGRCGLDPLARAQRREESAGTTLVEPGMASARARAEHCYEAFVAS